MAIGMNLYAQDWEPICVFDQNNNNIRVYELYPDTVSDHLYIGGLFYIINGDTMGNITSFDGANFQFMTDSMNACWNHGCDGVFSIIRYHDAIIAGLMQSSTYEARPQIVGIGHWDGQKWHPLDGGLASNYYEIIQAYLPAQSYDFAIADDTFYVAGYFKYVDSLPAAAMAAWDGTQWHTYDMPPIPPGTAILANSIAKYKDNIYLGGNFVATVDGQQANDLMRFDGTSWHKVGNGLIDGLTNLHDLEVFQGKLYVAGYFAKADGNPGNSIISWDGEQWNDLSGGVCTPFGTIDDLFVYKDKLYVAGYFDCIGGIEAHNVASWDGEKWCSIGNSMFNRAIHAVAVWRDTVYVGGSFFEVDGQPLRFLARFVGDHTTDTCSAPVSAAPEVLTSKARIRLWPNPATEMLLIESTGSIERVRIFDSTGKEVINAIQPISGTKEESITLDTRLLTYGLYYVTLQSSGNTHSGKFVKI